MARSRRSINQELNFVAKAGFLTKETWAAHFYDGNSRSGLNGAWRKLRSSGFFVPHPNHFLKDVLVLGGRGSQRPSSLAGPLVCPPGSAVMPHDEMIFRGILFLERQGLLEDWQLELGLKALGRDFVVSRNGGLTKYPDAWLYLKDSPAEIAVEVELHQKSLRRNEQIMKSYSSIKDAKLALFVSANPAIERALIRAARSHFMTTYDLELGFMSLEDWIKNPLEGEMRMKSGRPVLREWLEEIKIKASISSSNRISSSRNAARKEMG